MTANRYGRTSTFWDQHPDAKRRAFELADAFAAAGFHLQRENGTGWTARIEGEFMGEPSTLWEAGDTADKDIDRYVWTGTGNVSAIVAEYVKGADASGC